MKWGGGLLCMYYRVLECYVFIQEASAEGGNELNNQADIKSIILSSRYCVTGVTKP